MKAKLNADKSISIRAENMAEVIILSDCANKTPKVTDVYDQEKRDGIYWVEISFSK